MMKVFELHWDASGYIPGALRNPPKREDALHCELSGPWNAFKFFLWFATLIFVCPFWFCGIFQTRLNVMQMKSGDNKETNIKQKMPQIHWFFFFFHLGNNIYHMFLRMWKKHFFLRCTVTLDWMIMPWCRRINDNNDNNNFWPYDCLKQLSIQSSHLLHPCKGHTWYAWLWQWCFILNKRFWTFSRVGLNKKKLATRSFLALIRSAEDRSWTSNWMHDVTKVSVQCCK